MNYGKRHVNIPGTYFKKFLIIVLFFMFLEISVVAEIFISPVFYKDYIYLEIFGSAFGIYFFLIFIFRKKIIELNQPEFYSIVPSYFTTRPKHNR